MRSESTTPPFSFISQHHWSMKSSARNDRHCRATHQTQGSAAAGACLRFQFRTESWRVPKVNATEVGVLEYLECWSIGFENASLQHSSTPSPRTTSRPLASAKLHTCED